MNQTSSLSDPIPGLKGSNSRVQIEVATNSLFFRDLMVLLYYNKDAKTGLISDVKIDLKEAGMGVPGLIGDSMVPLIVLFERGLFLTWPLPWRPALGRWKRTA